ncbi:MAG TPA: response regulator transcription factor [Pseudonocardia sp.]|nr:response regulator transcription factor [Pseudonocardia sp.]
MTLTLRDPLPEWPDDARPGAVGLGTVLLAVPDPLLRTRLSVEMTGRAPCTVLMAGSAAEAHRLARSHAPGRLAVLDTALAGPGAPDEVHALLEALRRCGWDRVTVIGGRTDAVHVSAWLRAGAQACLFTAQRPPLPEVEWRPPASDGVRGHAVLDGRGQVRELSPREVEVLQLVAEGLSNAAVAERLGLSALTVKRHMARIIAKLDARDRTHVVLLALRAGVIT